MCIANSFASKYKSSKNKNKLKLKMQVEARSCKAIGDDHLYAMKDGSKLLDRVLVDEWQLFKGA